MLEKTLESPLDCKEIQPVHPKGNLSWILIGRTDAEAETPILWLPDVNNWLIGRDLDAGKDWRQEEKGTTEDEMVGWHHWLYGHEFEQALGIGDGQGSLVCCSPWGFKESDTTEWLNWRYVWGHRKNWTNLNSQLSLSSECTLGLIIKTRSVVCISVTVAKHLSQILDISSFAMIKNSIYHWSHICCCSVTRLCLTLCDPMNCSAPGSYGPPLSPRVCWNLCPLNRWCYWIISSSGASSSVWLWSFPVSGSFPMSQLLLSGG